MELRELAPDGPPRCQIIIPGVDNNELTNHRKSNAHYVSVACIICIYIYTHNYITSN